MTQKDAFLASEGDAWFRRNAQAVNARALPAGDPLLREIEHLGLAPGSRVLEIGCANGARLAWLTSHHSCSCSGIDPSAEAVEGARQSGVDAHVGTADRLPFADRSFDVVMFGFCLYLCDREDLFRIAQEADRVLRTPGWLLILDFYASAPVRRPYHHLPGVQTFKMDYQALFTWNPAYVLMTHKVRHHANDGYTDDPQEWTAVSVIRRLPNDAL